MHTSSLSAFDKQLMEIAYMGAFYGLAPLAETVFSLFADHPVAKQGAALGHAFAQLRAGDSASAAQTLETIAGNSETSCPEAKLLLIFAYRQMQTQDARQQQLAEEVQREAEGQPAADAARLLAAS